MALRTVGVRLTADIGQYVTNMKRAGVSTRSFVGDLAQANREHKLDDLTNSAAGLGLGLVGVAGAATKLAMDFDKQMSAVKAATHASTGEIDKLRAAAMKAGADTQYSATEAAKGIEELSKAGVSTADVLNGGLAGALSLAAAGEVDVGEAAETAASAMTQFKLKGKDLPHVADLLAAAAGKAQGSVHDMGQALNMAGLVAAQTGLTIEDTTGTLAAFANAGLIGSDAGTSFKQMLMMLQAPSGKTKELMDDLGISAYTAEGNFIGITALAGQLKEKLSKLTPEVRANAMAQIFGADATRAASIMYEQGAEGIQGWIDKTNDSGYAAETAALKTDNLAGDVERLTGSLETLAISAGSGSSGGLRTLVQGADNLVNSLSAIPGPVQSAVIGIAGITGAAMLAAAGVGKLKQAGSDALGNLSEMGPRGQKAATTLEKVGDRAGKAAVALVALQVASAAFGENLNPKIEALAGGMDKFAATGDMAGESARLFGGDLGKLDTALKDVADTGAWSSFSRGAAGMVEGITGAGNAFDDSLTKSRERLDAFDQALSQMVSSGRGVEAAAVFKKIADRAAEQGVSVDELKRALPGYAAALENAALSTEGVASGTQAATGATDALGNSVQGTAEKAKELQEAFDALFSQYMTADQAAIKFEETLISTNKELRKGSKTLAINSEEGRTNRKAVLDLIDAISDQRTANINGGMAVADADKQYKAQIETLKKNQLNLGYNEDAVVDLIGKYKKVPDDVSTQINQPGMGSAKANTQTLWDKLKGVDGNWTANIKTLGYAKTANELRHLLAAQKAAKEGTSVNEANRELGHFFATGGPVVGPGSGTSDSIAARLSNGEHVWTADEVAALGGQQAVKQLRAAVKAGKRVEVGDETPGFATGGPVVMPYPFTTKRTKIPQVPFLEGPSGSGASDWIVRTVHAAFPGMRILSKDRPGATTLSGNTSYHSRRRAVDWPASKPLAEWFNLHYKARIKELITPWNSLNIHNGQRHTYTGAVYRQHNFAGGNAHDHVAFGNGGVIKEPIVGVGQSGKTYSFGEYGPERVTPGAGNWMPQGSGGGGSVVNRYDITIQVPVGANQAEMGRQLVAAINEYERRSGKRR